jgi:predicted molibdopterin-dependent oxidoreductase YjgC
VFGAGGGTSSYREVEDAEVILLWGSNAREAHPIYFHRVLKALRKGAKLFVIDPRRTASAEFADLWLGLDIGTDIALANAMAREIIDADLHDLTFIKRATTGFKKFKESVDWYTLERAELITGIPGDAIRELAHSYANAKTAQILWTLGITEHHNAVDNVLSLCNLALLTGHVGRWGSGLVPLRGQNNVQGGGDMGALPDKLPGFQDITDDHARRKFELLYGTKINPKPGLHLTLMFEAMHRKDLRALYVIGENPAQSEADAKSARKALSELDTLIVQDIFLTRTAEMADVVFPASVGWAESNGTVTSSERRVQRVRPAVKRIASTKDDLDIIVGLADRLGAKWPARRPEQVWDEIRALSPMHAGMSYERLDEGPGIQWPCPTTEHPGTEYLHEWLWEKDLGGHQAAPFSVTLHEGPKEHLNPDYPLRLTTGRVLDSFNTGVQSRNYPSPIRTGQTIDLNAIDAEAIGISDGEIVKVSSKRGSINMTAKVVENLPAGLVFSTFHFPEIADINLLTNDHWDLKSGTSEFKASAVRIEKFVDEVSM